MAERQHQAAGVNEGFPSFPSSPSLVGPFFSVGRTFMSYDHYDIEEGFTGHLLSRSRSPAVYTSLFPSRLVLIPFLFLCHIT